MQDERQEMIEAGEHDWDCFCAECLPTPQVADTDVINREEMDRASVGMWNEYQRNLEASRANDSEATTGG